MQNSNGTSRPKSPQCKYWLATLNNPTDEIKKYCEQFNTASIKYTLQLEKGTNGTSHLQAFLWMGTRCRRTTVTKLFATGEMPHLEPARDPKAAERYCRKEETRQDGPYTNMKEEEIRNIGQGERTEISEACQLIIEGTPISTIARQFPTSHVRYHRGFQQIATQVQSPRDSKSIVLWVCGETGVGKSRCARQVAHAAKIKDWRCYVKSGETK